MASRNTSALLFFPQIFGEQMPGTASALACLRRLLMSLFRRGGVWWYDFQVRGVRIRETSGLTFEV